MSRLTSRGRLALFLCPLALLLWLAISAATPPTAASSLDAPTNLDPTFGDRGVVRWNSFPNYYPFATLASTVAVLPDNKILVAGTTSREDNRALYLELAVMRFTSSGEGDSLLYRDMRVIAVRDMALQSDGKILLLVDGWPSTIVGPRGFGLIRLLPDGTLDTSYGINGYLWIVTEPDPAWVYDYNTREQLVLDSQGRAIVAYIYADDFRLHRYRSDSTLDPTFGTTGTTTVPVPPSGATLSSLLLQPDGKLIVAGGWTESAPTLSNGLVARLTPNGALDSTFSADGVAEVERPVANLLLQSTGKLVLIETAFDTTPQLAIERLTADGALDSTFQSPAFTAYTKGYAATLVADAKFVVAYNVATPGGGTVAVVEQFLPDGPHDLTYGYFGRVTLDPRVPYTHALTPQPDGRLVGIGQSYSSENNYYYILFRLEEGQLQTTWLPFLFR